MRSLEDCAPSVENSHLIYLFLQVPLPLRSYVETRSILLFLIANIVHELTSLRASLISISSILRNVNDAGKDIAVFFAESFQLG